MTDLSTAQAAFGHATVVTDSQAQVHTLNMFFGKTLTSSDTGAFQGPITAQNLGQAYEGISTLIRNMVEQLVHTVRTAFWTAVILPITKLDAHHIAVAYRVWNKSINAAAPYEGSARMLTERVYKAEKSAQRRGVQAKFEGDFLQFASAGRQQLEDKLDHMRWTVQETLNYFVAKELSSAQDPFRAELDRTGKLEHESAERILAMESTYFGAAQKGPLNLAGILTAITEGIQQVSGLTPDTVILPAELRRLFEMSKRLPVKFPTVDGEGKITEVDSIIEATMFGNVRIFFTESVTGEDGRPRFSPFSSTSYTGQHYVIGDTWVGRSHDGWRSNMLNIYLHCESMDNYAKVRGAAAFGDPSMRWTRKGDLRPEHDPSTPEMSAYDAREHSSTERACGTRYRHDVFHMREPKVGWRKTEVFGALCPSHCFPDALLHECATTMCTGLGSRGYTPAESDRLVQSLRALVQNSDNNCDAPAEYFTRLADLNQKRFTVKLANGIWTVAPGQTMLIPGDAGDMGSVPIGVCTWMAMKALARHSGNATSRWAKSAAIASECTKFIAACAAHVASIAAKTQGHKRILDAWIPEWQMDCLAKDDTLDQWCCALFNMMIGAPRPPVFLKAAAGEAAGAGAGGVRRDALLLLEFLDSKEIGNVVNGTTVTTEFDVDTIKSFAANISVIQRIMRIVSEVVPEREKDGRYNQLLRKVVVQFKGSLQKVTDATVREYALSVMEGIPYRRDVPPTTEVKTAEKFAEVLAEKLAGKLATVAGAGWCRTIFGLGEGLTIYTSSPGASEIIAPADPCAGWSIPRTAWMPIQPGLRIGTRATGTIAALGEGVKFVGGPEARYGARTLNLSDVGNSEVARERVRGLYMSNSMMTPLIRTFATVLCMLPIHRDIIQNMLENDVMPPLAISIVRPFIQHQTKGIWIGKAGYDLGASFFGQEDTKAAWDAQAHYAIASLTYHAMAFVWNARAQKVVRNILDTEPCRQFDVDWCMDAAVAEKAGSMISRITSYYDVLEFPCRENEDQQLPTLISAIGKFTIRYGANEVDEPTRKPHMCCDGYYAKILKKYYETADRLVPLYGDDQGTTLMPHMCWRGEQYSARSPKHCDIHTPNAGPLGKSGSMPGSAAVRMGSVPYFPEWQAVTTLIP